MKTYIIFDYPAELFLEFERFQTKFVEKIATHILCSIFFSRKSCRLGDDMQKYGRAGQATDDNLSHSFCNLDN